MSFVEQRIEMEEMSIACYRGGRGFPLLLIHGSGPGASSTGYWRAVLEPMAKHFEIWAMDLIGFGSSSRKPRPPYFDVDLWMRQIGRVIEQIGAPALGIVGHSISASFALRMAAADRRVRAVVTTGAMGRSFVANDATRAVWTPPRDRSELRRTLQGTVFNKELISESYLDAREPVVFDPGFVEHFGSMFHGDKQRYIDAVVLGDETLKAVHCPVLLIHGRDDVPFPMSVSVELSERLADADLMILSRCAHSIAIERSETLVRAVESFFSEHAGNPE
ncbi:MAG: alpha/beta fold hydrolase [Alphaproteobacteria bacterium]|nr:alpha/beta fold hydrolase [Alphaproteobacteria bacterium]